MALPIIPVGIINPSLKNGRLGPCDAIPTYMPGWGHVSLHPKAELAWRCLAALAWGELGVHLTVTSPADAYRSYVWQEAVFRQRYRTPFDPELCDTKDARSWNGVTWWKLKGVAAVAVPGTSNHGWGLAVDVCLWNGRETVGITSDPRVWQWLQGQAVSLGWSWEMQSEPWHLRHYPGTERVTQRVSDLAAWFEAQAQAQVQAVQAAS